MTKKFRCGDGTPLWTHTLLLIRAVIMITLQAHRHQAFVGNTYVKVVEHILTPCKPNEDPPHQIGQSMGCM